MLYGTSTANIVKLLRVQNTLAQVTTYYKQTDHICPVLENLHWLLINCRIEIKISSLVYKVWSTGSPAYLQVFVSDYTPTRQHCSSNQLFLFKASVGTETARCSISQAAPTVCHNLPLDSRSVKTYERFRSVTRKHLYPLAFSNRSRDYLLLRFIIQSESS